MASAETTVERLRKFLRELRRERTLPVGELERSTLRGEDVAGGDLVLQELRRIMRGHRETSGQIRRWIQMKLLKSGPWSSS